MVTKKIITGKVTSKKYKCTSCGHVSQHSTNHYGEIYPPCPKCAWKNPMEFGQVHKCMEKVPKGWGTPEPWKRVKLGDIAEIKVIKPRRK